MNHVLALKTTNFISLISIITKRNTQEPFHNIIPGKTKSN